MYLSVPTPSLSIRNANKFRKKSNKLGKIGINWNGLTVVGREQSNLTYNSANYQ